MAISGVSSQFQRFFAANRLMELLLEIDLRRNCDASEVGMAGERKKMHNEFFHRLCRYQYGCTLTATKTTHRANTKTLLAKMCSFGKFIWMILSIRSDEKAIRHNGR